MLCGGPPVASIFFNVPPARNAIQRLSGGSRTVGLRRPEKKMPTSF